VVLHRGELPTYQDKCKNRAPEAIVNEVELIHDTPSYVHFRLWNRRENSISLRNSSNRSRQSFLQRASFKFCWPQSYWV